MTSILLPLVVSLASLGINAPRLTPVADLPSGNVGTEFLWSQDPLDPAAATPDLANLVAGSSYPEAYRWTSSSGSAELDDSGAPIAQAGLVSRDSQAITGFSDNGEPLEDEFSFTRGAGIVGIGFRWRFR